MRELFCLMSKNLIVGEARSPTKHRFNVAKNRKKWKRPTCSSGWLQAKEEEEEVDISVKYGRRRKPENKSFLYRSL